MTDYYAQPSPIGTPTNIITSPQPAPAPYPTSTTSTTNSSSGTDWNTMWNNIWNEYWNKGYNQEFGNASYAGSGDYASAQSQGYQAGLSKRLSTSSDTTGGEVKGTSNVPTGGDGGSSLDPILAEIDRTYNETINLANQREQTLRGYQPQVEANVTNQFAANQQSLEAEKTAGERGLVRTEEGSAQIKENALSAGRRLASELQIGNTQRFGGKSIAGNFVSEMIGREQQRGQATAFQAFQNTIAKVSDLRSNLQERYSAAMQTLRTQKDAALLSVKQAFDEKMDEINTMRVQAGENKSTMRLTLLQDLRNQVYQINLASVQTQTALDAQVKQGNDEIQKVLETYKQIQSNAGQELANQSIKSPAQATTGIAYGGSSPTSQQSYIGIRRPEEETVTGIRRPEDYLYA